MLLWLLLLLTTLAGPTAWLDLLWLKPCPSMHTCVQACVFGPSLTQSAACFCRSMHANSLQELPADLATYISQMKYYERMHKVKEREQHIQEVSLTFFTMFAGLHR
jgi:hypothetical protein